MLRPRRQENHPHAYRATVISSIVLAAVALGGCDTISQDFQLISQSFMPPSPREAAEMMVDQYDPDHRREGTVLIANSPFGGVEHYVDLYRFMVETEQDPTVRAVAVRALAKHGQPDDAPMIAEQLTHENEQVRWEAAKGLQRLHNPRVVPQLLEVVRNDEEARDVRIAAVHALGQYPQDRVFQVLIRALDARELAVNATAHQSLMTLTGKDFGDDPRQWVRWYGSVPIEERFAGQQEYVYATYYRNETIFERLAFWSSTNFETPQQPVGLRPRDERRTYEDDEFEGAAPAPEQ